MGEWRTVGGNRQLLFENSKLESGSVSECGVQTPVWEGPSPPFTAFLPWDRQLCERSGRRPAASPAPLIADSGGGASGGAPSYISPESPGYGDGAAT